METPELIPCPHCGKNAVYIGPVMVPLSGGKYKPTVMCNSCGAMISRSTKQSAIKAWNRRVTYEPIRNNKKTI